MTAAPAASVWLHSQRQPSQRLRGSCQLAQEFVVQCVVRLRRESIQDLGSRACARGQLVLGSRHTCFTASLRSNKTAYEGDKVRHIALNEVATARQACFATSWRRFNATQARKCSGTISKGGEQTMKSELFVWGTL